MKQLREYIKICFTNLVSFFKAWLNNKPPPVTMHIKTAMTLGIEKEFMTDDVIKVISYFRGSAVTEPLITLNSEVIKDLRIDEDDAVDMLLFLEERTGIKPPSYEWEKARTVKDIIDVLLKYGSQ